MADNPYLKNDNPYLNNFNQDELQTTNASNPYLTQYSSEFQNAQHVAPESEKKQEPLKQKEVQVKNNSNEIQQESFDLTDANAFMNMPVKKEEKNAKPYKDLTKKESKKSFEKKEKDKSSKKFSFKSFIIGVVLSFIIFVGALSGTVLAIYKTYTFAKIQQILNINISKGDLNDYSIEELINLIFQHRQQINCCSCQLN